MKTPITLCLSLDLIVAVKAAADVTPGCSVSHAFECLARAGAGMPQIPAPVRGRPALSLPLPKRTQATMLWAARKLGIGETLQAVVDAVWPGRGWVVEGSHLTGPGLDREQAGAELKAWLKAAQEA